MDERVLQYHVEPRSATASPRPTRTSDFACYSFVPKSDIPIKVIVLDDTVKGPGQPNYAAGCLDQPRLDWLTTELQAGQDNNQLMIIAAHIPFNTYRKSCY